MPPQTSPAASRFSFERASAFALIGTLIASLVIVLPGLPAPTLPTKVFVLGLGTIATLAFYVLARLTRGNLILPPLALYGALWLPLVAYVLSALFSGVGMSEAVFGRTFGTDTLGFMILATVLAGLGALILRRSDQFTAFWKTLAYAFSAIVGLQTLILIVGQFIPERLSPAFSLLGSFADLGMLLGLGVILILVTLRLVPLSARARKGLLAVGALSLLLLAVVNSTLIWTLVALVALALFVEAVMQRSTGAADGDLEGTMPLAGSDTDHEEGTRPLAVPLIVLALSLFFLLGSTLGNALASKLGVSVLSVRPSWQATVAVGSQVYGSSPVFGSGPSTFRTEWLRHRDASLNQTLFWNVDFTSGVGFIPTSMVTTGVLGTLAWIALLALFFFYGIRTLIFRASEDSVVRLVATLSFIGASYLLIVAILDVPSAPLIALAFVLLGVFASTLRFAKQGGQWGISFSKSPRIGFVIVFKLTLLLLASIGAAYLLIEHYIAQVDYARASAALNAGDIAGAESALAHSLSFAPSAVAYTTQARITQVKLQQIASGGSLNDAETAREFQAVLSAGINAAITGTRVAPTDYQAWLELGNLYAFVVPIGVEGADANAKTAYEKAAELNPTSPLIPYALAQLAIAKQDTAMAREYLTQAITLKQNYTAAIFLLSQLEVRAGNLKEALAAAEAAAYFTPDDQNVLFQLGLLRAANNDTAGAIVALAKAVSVNAEFANARYFLAAAYAKKGDFPKALAELQALAALSEENAKAVADAMTALSAGKNPFPANLLSGTVEPIKSDE